MSGFDYTISYGGGIGPDVWDSIKDISAVDIFDAADQARGIAEESGGWVFGIQQNDFGPKWSRELPSSSGLWWWWNEDEDSAPIVVDIAYSGTSNSFFASIGQHGWTRFQETLEMGGWWMRAEIPHHPINQ